MSESRPFALCIFWINTLKGFHPRLDIFYLRPKKKFEPDSPWYDCVPVGKEKLSSLQGGIAGRAQCTRNILCHCQQYCQCVVCTTNILGVGPSSYGFRGYKPLCKHHYHTVYYDALQTQQNNCRMCNRCLKAVNDRHCPQPKVVKDILT